MLAPFGPPTIKSLATALYTVKVTDTIYGEMASENIISTTAITMGLTLCGKYIAVSMRIHCIALRCIAYNTRIV